MTETADAERGRASALPVRVARATWQVITGTVGGSFRYRVTGLAAEAAFFAILSLPALVVALAASIGFFADWFDVAQVDVIRDKILSGARQILTEQSVNRVIEETLDVVLRSGRLDVFSVGFIFALWSGSRALNVFVDTITIMYGLGGRRGIIKTRLLSFTLYLVGVVLGVVVLPLVVIGPEIMADLLPDQMDFLSPFYWPTLIVLSIAFLTSLYHLSVPVRTSWLRDLPGGTFALGMWILGSYALRWFLQNVVGSESLSIYGPLAAPIAVLLWLYITALVVLIGAALNAAFDRAWPESETARARLEVVRRLRRAGRLERLRGTSTDAELTGLAELEEETSAEVTEAESDETSTRPLPQTRPHE